MSRVMAEAPRYQPQRSGQGRHRPPMRSQAEIPFEPQRSAGRAVTQRTQIVQPPPRVQRELRASRASRMAMYAFVVLVVVLAFAQIGQLANMAQNTKEIASLTATIREKKGETGNLNMRLSMQHNIKRVRDEAVGRLGMIQPEDGQIRVISPMSPSAETQQQTVMNSQGSVD